MIPFDCTPILTFWFHPFYMDPRTISWSIILQLIWVLAYQKQFGILTQFVQKITKL